MNDRNYWKTGNRFAKDWSVGNNLEKKIVEGQ